jgi:tRNA pseudouridine32 synthase
MPKTFTSKRHFHMRLDFDIIEHPPVTSPPSPNLAPSPRVLAYLLRRGRIPASSMAVTVVEPAAEAPEVLQPPPAVVTTPCDPWPRPYYLEDGLRRVAPYHYTYNTNVKERWRGRRILDIFRDEFRDRPEEYYVGPIEGWKDAAEA